MYDLRLFRLFCGVAQVCIDLYTVMVRKGIQVPRGNIGKTTKKKRWRKRQSRSCRFSFHKHFTIFFHLLLLFLYFIFFFYTFFTHEIYPHPHPHPGPTPTTHDLYPLPTTFSYTRFSGAAYPIHEYRVSQKFVPLITRDFWSKLHFCVKFLKDVYCFNEYIYSESQYPACPPLFVITFRSLCGMEWDKSCSVESEIFFQACLSRLFRSWMVLGVGSL